MNTISFSENNYNNLAFLIRGRDGELDELESYISVEAKRLPFAAQEILKSIYPDIELTSSPE